MFTAVADAAPVTVVTFVFISFLQLLCVYTGKALECIVKRLPVALSVCNDIEPDEIVSGGSHILLVFVSILL